MRQVAQAVYIRAGYGNDGYDGMTEINATGAKAAGMPWGLYWFVKVGKDFKKHVASFQNVWQEFGGALSPVFDIEYTEYTTNTKEQTTNWLTKLVKLWEETTGVMPMIYTRTSWWNPNTSRSDWPKLHDLWIAQYNSAISQPSPLPDDWAKINNPKTWVQWQWSADGNGQGAAHGVSSVSIDCNRFNGSIDDFNRKYKTDIKPLGEVTPPPPPPPSDDGIKPLYRVKVMANALNVRGRPDVSNTDYGELLTGSLCQS